MEGMTDLRNRWYRLFWTELGRGLTGGKCSVPEGLPCHMADVLRSPLAEPSEGKVLVDRMISQREGRFIYGRTWDILREMGFSRPLRLAPWPGTTLLLPFHRGSTAVLPQSFSDRVPEEDRALSLVGRSAAASVAGYRLVVVMARWTPEVLAILDRGGVSACSLDNLETMCSREEHRQPSGP